MSRRRGFGSGIERRTRRGGSCVPKNSMCWYFRLDSTSTTARAQAEADGRALIDLFIDVVKEEVPDEQTRDRIARALLETCPTGSDAENVH